MTINCDHRVGKDKVGGRNHTNYGIYTKYQGKNNGLKCSFYEYIKYHQRSKGMVSLPGIQSLYVVSSILNQYIEIEE